METMNSERPEKVLVEILSEEMVLRAKARELKMKKEVFLSQHGIDLWNQGLVRMTPVKGITMEAMDMARRKLDKQPERKVGIKL